jgi:hypothetical protein
MEDYRDVIGTEHKTWKAKTQNILSKLERISPDHREALGSACNEIETIIKEINERIDQLQRGCPDERNLRKNDLDGQLTKLKELLKTALPTEAFFG